MNRKILMLALISIFVLTVNAEASDKKIKVYFTIVPTSDTALASETRSYIGRELRSLQDVEIMIRGDESIDFYFISIVPVTLKPSNGANSGVVVSYVIEKGFRIEHNVLIGGPNDLKKLCEKIIAYFDTYWLEPERKSKKK